MPCLSSEAQVTKPGLVWGSWASFFLFLFFPLSFFSSFVLSFSSNGLFWFCLETTKGPSLDDLKITSRCKHCLKTIAKFIFLCQYEDGKQSSSRYRDLELQEIFPYPRIKLKDCWAKMSSFSSKLPLFTTDF